jgi:hypothetical protein
MNTQYNLEITYDRKAYIHNKILSLITDIIVLSQNYTKVEDEKGMFSSVNDKLREALNVLEES